MPDQTIRKTYANSYAEWTTILRETCAEDPCGQLAELLERAACDLTNYHPRLDDPYDLLVDLDSTSWDHYDAAHDEADARFADNDRAICRVYNVAWCALYLWFHDRLYTMVHGGTPDARLMNPN